jgi:LysR family transcriptional activator of nhaA
MDWLNHHHLHYFWVVAREGSIARASKVLHLTPQTISAQLKELEGAIGAELLVRRGRGLVLTDTGQVVRRYADEIFTLSRELVDTVRGRPTDRPLSFRVGVSDVVPRLVAHRILSPALSLPTEIRLECRSEQVDDLLAKLALHQLDLVLSDAPLPASLHIRAFNHLLGSSDIVWLGSRELATTLKRQFPRSLDGAPVLLPSADTAFRRAIDAWLDGLGVRPRIVGEFQDSGLLKSFGEAGDGIFPAPRIVQHDVRTHFNVALVGEATGVVQSYYAISVERRVRHPAVAAIRESARRAFVDA